MVNKLTGKYNPKKTYKFAFMDIETHEWFLANKKPVGIKVKKGYWGSVLDTHYQYRISTFAYDYDNRYYTKQNYTEYEFVCIMYKKSMDDMREQKRFIKNNPDQLRFVKNYEVAKNQKAFFKKRMEEIKNSREYLIELLTK